MKTILIFSSLLAGFLFVSEARAQTPVVFGRGTSSKTITVTVPARGSKSFSVAVNRRQVINVNLSGDIAVSRTNEFPAVSVNLTNGRDGVDNWQDGEGYLSVLTGSKKTYIFNVANSSRRARTFKMRVKVTSNPDDYFGGTE